MSDEIKQAVGAVEDLNKAFAEFKSVNDQRLAEIEKKGTADALRHWSGSLEALRGQPRKQKAMLDAMLELIAKDLVPLRPNREEPRARKRRPKNYHLLTKPRYEMLIRGHRNRPKSGLS